jgi:hypothetical protein
MSTIARAVAVVGSLYGLLRNRLGINVATPLGAQELSCTVAPDRRLVVLGHEPIAGFARDHGTVADEAAMLALHTLDSTTLLAEPTFVAPGDSVLRADDPGWRWHCISGHGQALSDWERRPLAGALAGLAAAGHTHTTAQVSGLAEALDEKQNALSNAAALARISAGPVIAANGSVSTTPLSELGGGGFAPAALLGCAEWHDTTEAANCLDADGNACAADVACATWLDLSGNGRDLVTPSAGADRRPIFRAAARHDLGALDTAPNGTLARYLERTANLGAEGFGHEFTLYFVRKRTDGATESTFGELANYGDVNNQQNRWLLLHAPYTNGNTYADGGNDTGMRISGSIVWGTNWQTVAFVRKYGRLYLIVDGYVRLSRTTEDVPTAWTAGSHVLMVGGALNSQYGEFVGNALLGAFGVWPRALSVGELGQLDAWAGARYLG